MKKSLGVFAWCAFGSALALIACGGPSSAKDPTQGAAPVPSSTTPGTAASSLPVGSTGADAGDEHVRASTVRFDDIGLSLVVPTGFRAIGDGEFAARIRASSTPKTLDVLQRSLKSRRAFPLLTLTRDSDPWGSATFSVVGVPNDVRAEELLNQEREIMSKHFQDFKVISPAQNYLADGVDASRLDCSYRLKEREVVSSLRVFVRQGMALLVSSMHGPDSTESTAQSEVILDGIHFYPPTP